MSSRKKRDERSGTVTRETLLEFSELYEHGVPYSRSHLYRLEDQGKFPKRVPIGELRVGWVAGEIWDWRDAKLAVRGAKKRWPGGATKKREVKIDDPAPDRPRKFLLDANLFLR